LKDGHLAALCGEKSFNHEGHEVSRRIEKRPTGSGASRAIERLSIRPRVPATELCVFLDRWAQNIDFKELTWRDLCFCPQNIEIAGLTRKILLNKQLRYDLRDRRQCLLAVAMIGGLGCGTQGQMSQGEAASCG
jgi:hypothetical protein